MVAGAALHRRSTRSNWCVLSLVLQWCASVACGLLAIGIFPVSHKQTHPASNCLRRPGLHSLASRDGRALVGRHRDGAAAGQRRPACYGGEVAPL